MIKQNNFIQINKENPFHIKVSHAVKTYSKEHPEQLIFCLSSPLGIETSYNYDGMFILSPGHEITFLGDKDDENFILYINDVLEDLSSLSLSYNYQKYIGRPREWRDRIVKKDLIPSEEAIDIGKYIGEDAQKVTKKDARLVNYLISLLTGSINELNDTSLDEDGNLLDEIRRRIILFDADQTRFLYNDYQIRRFISVQGLSGTGKTELLMHKLREVYLKNESEFPNRIFFTCHNIALANEIRLRVPDFFNKMKVNRQIEWGKELWVSHAWGSRADPNSGLYSFLCHYYQLPFYHFSKGAVDYEYIFSKLKKGLDDLPKSHFKPCFNYILIDENQDFPEVFFEVCKKVTKNKVFTAGDVFQNIFYQKQNTPKGFDISLNRCYRTDPRTLMFAHTLGLGLKENIRYNWFEKEEWESFGYKYKLNKANNTFDLYRLPITRFDGAEPKESVIINNGTSYSEVCDILKNLIKEYPNINPEDVAIILIDDDQDIYGYMEGLALKIRNEIGWDVLRGHEVKHTETGKLYLTNTNNVKGLEFPFVICITSKILNKSDYRNRLYTMLTRSFLITYLLIKDRSNLLYLKKLYEDINKRKGICEINIASNEEREKIRHALLKRNETKVISWVEFINDILNDMKILNEEKRKRMKNIIQNANIDKFNENEVKKVIQANINFL